MMRTATNVTGDMAVSATVARSENMIDESVLAAELERQSSGAEAQTSFSSEPRQN